MAKGDDIQKRLIDFAVKIIKLCTMLPKNESGKHVSVQLLQSGTSPAPNYGEARGAESKSDFVHKLKIVLKELNESDVWLEIIKQSEMLSVKIIDPLQKECNELARIINSSILTTNRNRMEKSR